jgi:hypothetical protein
MESAYQIARKKGAIAGGTDDPFGVRPIPGCPVKRRQDAGKRTRIAFDVVFDNGKTR